MNIFYKKCKQKSHKKGMIKNWVDQKGMNLDDTAQLTSCALVRYAHSRAEKILGYSVQLK